MLAGRLSSSKLLITLPCLSKPSIFYAANRSFSDNKGSGSGKGVVPLRSHRIEESIRESQMEGININETMKAWEKYNYEPVEREWWKDGKRMTFWSNFRMKKDVRNRKAFEECGPDRLRLGALVNNNILPNAIKELASDQLLKLPYQKKWQHGITPRCQLTSRRRGNVRAYNISRIMFKELNDHGKVSGMIRAKWG